MEHRHNDEMMMVAIARLEEKMDAQVEIGQKTLEQALKTNGRVSKLENWRSYMTGALAVITLVVLPSLAYVAVQIIHVSVEQRNIQAAALQAQPQVK